MKVPVLTPKGAKTRLKFSDMNAKHIDGRLLRRVKRHPSPKTPWAHVDLIGSVVAALGLWGTYAVPFLEPIRVMLGLVLGLFVPGYLIMELLIPSQKISRLERVGLSLAMNIVLLIVMGLLMALVQFPFTASHVMLLLLIVTMVLAASNFWVRQHGHGLRSERGGWSWKDWRVLGVVGGVAALVLMTGIIVSRTLADRTVAFSITSPQGQLAGFPYEIPVGQKYPMRLNVSNPHARVEVFQLHEIANASVIRKETVKVSAHGHWSQLIVLPSREPGRMHVEFRLLQEKGGLFRQLWITYRITP